MLRGSTKTTATIFSALGNGVIGNTAVSGTVIQGSSPCSPTTFPREWLGNFESQLEVETFFFPL